MAGCISWRRGRIRSAARCVKHSQGATCDKQRSCMCLHARPVLAWAVDFGGRQGFSPLEEPRGTVLRLRWTGCSRNQ